MRFINSRVPDITVVSEGEFITEIKSMQGYDESDDRVYVQCAEYVEQFKRGFICDLVCHYSTCDNLEKNEQWHSETIKDLVLVHVNKTYDIDTMPKYEYVFYK